MGLHAYASCHADVRTPWVIDELHDESPPLNVRAFVYRLADEEVGVEELEEGTVACQIHILPNRHLHSLWDSCVV